MEGSQLFGLFLLGLGVVWVVHDFYRMHNWKCPDCGASVPDYVVKGDGAEGRGKAVGKAVGVAGKVLDAGPAGKVAKAVAQTITEDWDSTVVAECAGCGMDFSSTGPHYTRVWEHNQPGCMGWIGKPALVLGGIAMLLGGG